MLRSATSRVAWLGRIASTVFGLALVLALLFGVASMALAGTGVNGVFNLGVKNTVNVMTQLVSSAGAGPAGPMLRVGNNSDAAGATGLQILTEAGNPPMRVNSQARVPNLNAALAGRADSAASADFAALAQTAVNAEMVGGKAIDELPGSMVQTVGIVGAVETAPPFGTLGFYGPTAEVTTSSTQRLVGVVSVPLKVVDSNNTGNPLEFTYGLCYRAAGTTNTPVLFYGGANEARGIATTTPVSWAAAQTKVPGLPNTWDVGFCARNGSNNLQTLSGAGSASGWIAVVNATPDP